MNIDEGRYINGEEDNLENLLKICFYFSLDMDPYPIREQKKRNHCPQAISSKIRRT